MSSGIDSSTTGWSLPVDELARRLSTPLPGWRRGWDIDVTRIERAADKRSVTLDLTCRSTAESSQQWQLTLPGDPEEDELLTDSLVLVLRANVEEWWDTREREPLVAARGRLVS